MNRKEAKDRFNALPKEHRETVIASELQSEILWMERQKIDLINDHKQRLSKINERIKTLEKHLEKL